MRKIYSFGYNSFRQTDPENNDDIISAPSDITESTQCDNIIWANTSSTLGINKLLVKSLTSLKDHYLIII